jgi:hypothetical protein
MKWQLIHFEIAPEIRSKAVSALVRTIPNSWKVAGGRIALERKLELFDGDTANAAATAFRLTQHITVPRLKFLVRQYVRKLDNPGDITCVSGWRHVNGRISARQPREMVWIRFDLKPYEVSMSWTEEIGSRENIQPFIQVCTNLGLIRLPDVHGQR